MTKDQARQKVIESGVFGKEFVPIWEEKYESIDAPLEERVQMAVADTIFALVDNYRVDDEAAYQMYEITVIMHAFVEYTGYIMK
jgi:hypothetical protein